MRGLIIQKITSKRGYFELSFDKGAALLVSEDILVRYRLLKGTEIKEAQYTEIERAAKIDQGFQLAVNYISYQLRSEKEVRDYLRQKEIPSSEFPKIIEQLKTLSLVDDQVFAESFVRTQMRLSDKGPRTISQKLREKGIAPEIIDQALELFQVEDQLALAKKVGEKAVRRNSSKSFREQKQKVQQHLLSKGFSSDVIREAMATLLVESDPDEEWQSIQIQGEQLWRRHQRLDPSKRRQKMKQSLFQKGFSFDLIERFLQEKDEEDDE